MLFVTLVDRTNSLIGRFAAWLGLAMVFAGAGNAIASFIEPYAGRRLSSVGVDELQWYLFSALFLLAAPWALAENAHVRVDVLYGRLGERGKAWTDTIGGVLLLIPFCIYAIVVTFPTAIESLRVHEASPDPGGLARWPIKLIVPFAFTLLALQGVANVIRSIATLRGTQPPTAAATPIPTPTAPTPPAADRP